MGENDGQVNVDNLHSLIENFRTEQLVMSSSMLNESTQLGLPRKLAVAEVEEAEERSAKGKYAFCLFVFLMQVSYLHMYNVQFI